MKLLSNLAFILALAFAGTMPAACATHKAAEPDIAAVQKLIAEDRMFDAFEMLKPMAENGNPDAQYELGGFYHYGYVGSNNFFKANEWYQRAAHQGSTDAMIGLAVLYAAGQGTAIDQLSAFTWLTIASERLTDQGALAKVDGLRNQLQRGLSQEQLNAALAAARAFQPVAETSAN